MKNLFICFLVLLVSTIAFGNAPPGETVKDNFITVQTDNSDCQVLTAYVAQDVFVIHDHTAKVTTSAQRGTLEKPMLWEVSYPLKISVSVLNSNSALTEQRNALLSMATKTTDVEQIVKGPLVDNNSWRIKDNKRNSQHTNYGYPLSAN